MEIKGNGELPPSVDGAEMLKDHRVTPDHARPAGKPDECFYCRQPIGALHGVECIIPQKKVRMRAVVEFEVWQPASHSPELIEFGYNESSWCADSFVRQLDDYVAELEAHGSCLCAYAKFEYLGLAQGIETRSTETPQEVPSEG